MGTDYHVGTSGWHYEHWKENFYPGELSKSKWLEFYGQHFPTVELNNSFYHLPTEKAFQTWRDSSPEGFTFAVKVSRFITHIKRLRNVEEPLENFLKRATLLQKKLGPLLYQLPPSMKRDDALLESFLSLLPQGLRHAFEFRNESWFEEGVYHLLRRYRAALCAFDMPGFTTPLVATVDFAYIRFHGSTWMYGGCYSEEELGGWAKRISGLGVEAAYIYFNNDAEGFAVSNARTLGQMLGLSSS